MNNESITLIIYGGLTFLLAFGGIYTLRKGFQLIMSGRGKSQENSTIKFLGLHVSTGSIGAFVMITAFMWAWAATQSLPQYSRNSNGDTQILRNKLMLATNQVRDLTIKNTRTNTQLVALKVDMREYVAVAKQNEVAWSGVINTMKNSAATINPHEYNQKLEQVLEKQKIDLNKFKRNINIDRKK